MENFRRNWVILMMLIAINSLYALGDEMRYNVTFNSESLRIDTVFSNTGIPFLSIFSSESDFCGNRGEFMLPYKSVRLIVPHIQSEGELRFRAFKDIVMKNDKVSDGGKLSVVAKEVTLDAGFEIEKGGELIINCINR